MHFQNQFGMLDAWMPTAPAAPLGCDGRRMDLCLGLSGLDDGAAPQRTYALREVFNGPRRIVRTGAPWRMLPRDLPPWAAVYQPTQRWMRAGVFETIVHDQRVLIRVASARARQPSAAIFDARTVHSTPESGQRAGYDGHKRRNVMYNPIKIFTILRVSTPTAPLRSSASTAGQRLAVSDDA